jgi:hypothetical protein
MYSHLTNFQVFRNIYSSDECERTRNAMWDIVEEGSPGFQHGDPSTWGQYSSAGKYGLSMRGPCFQRDILNNRQSPKLISAIGAVIESDDVMVSHDRFTIYRATGPEIPGGDTFRTGARNVVRSPLLMVVPLSVTQCLCCVVPSTWT